MTTSKSLIEWISKEELERRFPVAEEVGRKDDTGKPDWSLMLWEQLEEVQAVLDYGAKKYKPYNWMLVDTPSTRYLSAMLRHMVAYAKGDRLDAESGLPHLAHAICCALFLMYFDGKEPCCGRCTKPTE
jgi:hypothetical protein